MKAIFTFLVALVLSANTFAQEAKDAAIKSFTEGVVSFKDVELNQYSPIASFNKVAYAQAEKSIVLTKENMNTSLMEASKYKYCIITVGTHTIAKVADLNKKVMSGSWGCRIPFGQGYVQKGTLAYKEDYLNNIIGIPDAQRRMMFLFN